MPRIDIWDVAEPDLEVPSLSCGFPDGFKDRYTLGKELGRGGFGVVRVVQDVATGMEWACKSIKKSLDLPNVNLQTQQRHLDNIKREVAILRKLRGTLDVVHLEDVLEDEEAVHLVMEYCRGGELLHNLGKRHYSEETVADYMRGVLRTIAQCHHNRILHRDIKPGNFMLLTEAEDAPLKAIDFGVATFFDPKKLPITDLGLEGTPWFMAPEILSSKVGPGVDVWAAGIMAYQLLSGAFPFNDWSNTRSPALSKVWRSILTEEAKLSGSAWKDISDLAKDFIKAILVKEPSQRPTAKQALKHPWLAGGDVTQRGRGPKLSSTVVQKLQRYGLGNVFKRTILDMITNELLNKHAAASEAEAEQAQQQQQQQQPQQQKQLASVGEEQPGQAEVHDSAESPLPPALRVQPNRGIDTQRKRKALAMDLLQKNVPTAPKCLTVHAGADAYKMMVAPSRGPMSRGPHLPSGVFVPPPQGAFGSQAWWSSQAALSELTAQRRVSFGGLQEAQQQQQRQQQQQQVESEGQARQQGGSASAAAEEMEVDNVSPAPIAAAAVGGSMHRFGTQRGPSLSGAAGRQLSRNTSFAGQSGHALEHYAFYMGIGEHFNNLLTAPPKRSPGTAPLGSGSPPASFQPAGPPRLSPPQMLLQASKHEGHSPIRSLRRSGDSFSDNKPPETRDGMLRLLDSVQRQRQEHRKVQRLSLDTSGRGLMGYVNHAGGGDAAEGMPRASPRNSVEQRDGVAMPQYSRVLPTLNEGMPSQDAPPHANHLGSTGFAARSRPVLGSSWDSRAAAAAWRPPAGPTDMDTEAAEEEQQGSALGAAGKVAAGGKDAGVSSSAMGLWQPGNGSLVEAAALPGQQLLTSGLVLLGTSPDGVGDAEGRRRGLHDEEEGGRHGKTGYAALMAASASGTGPGGSAPATASTLGAAAAEKLPANIDGMPSIRVVSRIHVPPVQQQQPAASCSRQPSQEPSVLPPTPQQQQQLPLSSAFAQQQQQQEAAAAGDGGVGSSSSMSPEHMLSALSQLMPSQEQLEELKAVLHRLQYDSQEELSFKQISEGLHVLGYRLEPGEVEVLLRELAGKSGTVTQSQFIASQVDWRAFQANHRDEWLSCLRKTFEDIDVDSDGRLQPDDIIEMLGQKLPEGEINLAVQEMLMDAALGPEGIDFDDFCRLVREDSQESLASSLQGLDLYDARFEDEYHPSLATVSDDL